MSRMVSAFIIRSKDRALGRSQPFALVLLIWACCFSLTANACAAVSSYTIVGCAEAKRGDYGSAEISFRAAAAAGDPAGMYMIGVLYQNGNGVKRNYAKCMKWYRAAAAGQIYPAMTGIGDLYALGEGVPKNYATARLWYLRAAAHGAARAMFDLGLLNARGAGVKKNLGEAMVWFRGAAARHYAAAMRDIGNLYARGLGVAQNTHEAFIWWRKAAEAGDASAMLLSGQCYVEGHGVPKDTAQGVVWLRNAIAAGNVAAMAQLGYLYLKGTGVDRNFEVAMKWFRKAADHGNTAAMIGIGAMYIKGHYVHRSVSTAAAWFRRAADAGSPDAKKMLAIIYGTSSVQAQESYHGPSAVNLRAEGGRWTITVVMGVMALAACVVLIMRFRSTGGVGSESKPRGISFLNRLPTAMLGTIAAGSAGTAAFMFFHPQITAAIFSIAYPACFLYTMFFWLRRRRQVKRDSGPANCTKSDADDDRESK